MEGTIKIKRRRRHPTGNVGMAVIAMWCMTMVWSARGIHACSAGNKGCKECIVKQIDCECPGCRPVLRCLAGCLWDGVEQSKCVKTCDSGKGKGKPRLSRCKRCLSACKCTCVRHRLLRR